MIMNPLFFFPWLEFYVVIEFTEADSYGIDHLLFTALAIQET
jgi:hypothetical protein